MIKDLVDLVGRLIESVQDRKFAAELREVQGMISGLLSEHAALHESRIALMNENQELKNKHQPLRDRITELERECELLRNPPHTAEPTDEDISLMKQLTHPYGRYSAIELSKRLSVPLPLLDYKAQLLRSAGYLSVEYNDRIPSFSLSRKGRQFMYERNLLA